eukprot:2416066-Rhodomonas_salina.11
MLTCIRWSRDAGCRRESRRARPRGQLPYLPMGPYTMSGTSIAYDAAHPLSAYGPLPDVRYDHSV